MKKLSKLLVTLAFAGLSISTAYAKSAAELATQINTFVHGGMGTLNAVYSGNTVFVTSSSNMVTNVTNRLTLNIDAGVTVIWKANYEGAASFSDILIYLSGGTGIFEVSTDGIIRANGDSYGVIYNNSNGKVYVNGGEVTANCADCSRAILNNMAGEVTVSGGKVTANNSTGMPAIENSPVGTLNISGGEVSGSTYAVVNDGTVTISGGTVRGISGAITNYNSGGWVTISGGVVQATGNGSTVIDNSGTLIISGGMVQATNPNGKAIENNFGTTTITGGTVQADHDASGIAVVLYNGAVFVSDNAVVTSANTNINKGTIYLTEPEESILPNERLLAISGGMVKNTATNGVAVCNNSQGEVIISGGTVQADGVEGIAVLSDDVGGMLTISGGVVQSTNGFSVANVGSTAIIEGGTVQASGNNGIAVLNQLGKTTISGNAVVTSANTNSNKGTIYLGPDGSSPDWRLKINGGTVKNTSTGNAICTDSEGEIVISGGMVLAKEGFAVKDLNFTDSRISINGGIVFAYANDAAYVLMRDWLVDFTGNSIVAGWYPTIPSPYTYTAGTSNDIHTFTESTTAVWAKQSSENGILVNHNGNTGFIPIEGVTVTGGTGIEELRVASLPVAYYSITGQKLLREPQSGIYIVLYDNGKMAKKIVKE